MLADDVGRLEVELRGEDARVRVRVVERDVAEAEGGLLVVLRTVDECVYVVRPAGRGVTLEAGLRAG